MATIVSLVRVVFGPAPVLELTDQGGTVSALSAQQLTATGAVTPTNISVTPVSYGPAFDAQSNLWVAVGNIGGPSTSYSYMYTPSQLSAGGNPKPAVSVTLPGAGTFVPTALAFDRRGTLWVGSALSGYLIGFASSQLTTTGTPSPAYGVSAHGVSHVNDLAFDRQGNLWIIVDEAPQSDLIVALSSGQLAQGGVVSPIDSIVLGTGYLNSRTVASSLAFDSVGNLWVATGTDAVMMFSRAVLPTSSTSAVTLTPSVTVPVSGFPVALAFDSFDNLWVTTNNIDAPSTQVFRFPASALDSGNASSPDITLTLQTDAAHTFESPYGMAFAPGDAAPTSGQSVPRRPAKPYTNRPPHIGRQASARP